jgi:hypothetical protein
MRLKTLKPWVSVERDGSNYHGNLDDVVEVPRRLGLQRIQNGDAVETSEPLWLAPTNFVMLDCPRGCGMANSSLAVVCERCRRRLL